MKVKSFVTDDRFDVVFVHFYDGIEGEVSIDRFRVVGFAVDGAADDDEDGCCDWLQPIYIGYDGQLRDVRFEHVARSGMWGLARRDRPVAEELPRIIDHARAVARGGGEA